MVVSTAIVGVCLCIVAVIGHTVLSKWFFSAIANGNLDTAQKLLAFHPYLVSSTDRSGSSALNNAVEIGDLEVVRLLIRKGSDVNHDSRHGMPLHMAAYYGRAEIVKELLDAGADVNSESQWVPRSFGGTPLHQAAAGGRPDVIQILLDHGANVDATESNYHQTPLHYVIRPEPEVATRLDALRLLLSRGADVNARDVDGRSALSHLKAFPKIYDTKQMIEVLQSHGAR